MDSLAEPFDEIARAIQVRAELDRVFAIAFRRDVGPRALLADKLPDPARVIPTIREQHRLWKQGA